MAVAELHDFRKGRKTRDGRPLSADELPPAESVTVVTRGDIDRFLGTRSRRRRTEHLRALRDRGILMSRPRSPSADRPRRGRDTDPGLRLPRAGVVGAADRAGPAPATRPGLHRVRADP